MNEGRMGTIHSLGICYEKVDWESGSEAMNNLQQKGAHTYFHRRCRSFQSLYHKPVPLRPLSCMFDG